MRVFADIAEHIVKEEPVREDGTREQYHADYFAHRAEFESAPDIQHKQHDANARHNVNRRRTEYLERDAENVVRKILTLFQRAARQQIAHFEVGKRRRNQKRGKHRDKQQHADDYSVLLGKSGKNHNYPSWHLMHF